MIGTLESLNSQIKFEFPQNFFPKELNDKWMRYFRIKGMDNTFHDLATYVKTHLISVTVPGFSYTGVTQTINTGRPITYKPSVSDQALFSGDLTITFQDVGNGLLYFALYDLVMYHYTTANSETEIFLGDFVLYTLDHDGDAFMRVLFKQGLVNNVQGLTYSFNDNKVPSKTFTITIKYNAIDIGFLFRDELGDRDDGDILLDEWVPGNR